MSSANLPATQHMTEDTVLFVRPWQVIHGVRGHDVRIRLRRYAALPHIRIERVYRDRRGIAACTGKDLTCIVQCLAERVGNVRSQPVERADLQFILQAVISGPGPVVARAHQREIAIRASPRSC